MKKLLCILIAVVLICMSFAGCTAKQEAPAKTAETETKQEEKTEEKTEEVAEETKDVCKVAIVSETAFGNQSYTDIALNGCKKAEADLDNVELVVLESVDVSNAANALRTLIQEGVTFIILPTSSLADAITEVAPENPNVYFASLDVEVPGYDNVYSCVYRENEACFLLGILAANCTKTGKVAFTGGIAGSVMSKYEFGYKAGVAYVNPDVEVSSVYINSYSDPNKGKEIGSALFGEGYDFIEVAAGGSGMGVFEAAEEKNDECYCFGGTGGQFDLGPNKILASQTKTVDEVCYSLITDAAAGKLAERCNEPEKLGLAENGVALIYTTLNDELLKKFVSDDISQAIEDAKAKIISGEISVPASEEEYNSFVAGLK